MKKLCLSLLIIVIVGVGGFFAYNYFFKDNLNYIMIDINPSVQLGVNEDDKVVEVVALNEDADILLSDMNLEDMELEEAVDSIVDEAVEIGYIDEFSNENQVVVSSCLEKKQKRLEYENKISERIRKRLENRNVYAEVLSNGVTDEIKAEADEVGVSYGKMLLIERAVTLNPELDKNELLNSSIKDIQTEITSKVKERRKLISDDAKELEEILDQMKEEKIENRNNKLNQIKEEVIEKYEDNLDEVDSNERETIINNLIEQRKKDIFNQRKNNKGRN
jgi:hypothetical protein